MTDEDKPGTDKKKKPEDAKTTTGDQKQNADEQSKSPEVGGEDGGEKPADYDTIEWDELI